MRADPAQAGRPWRWRAGAAAAGALLALTHPEPGLWWLALAGLVPVLVVVRAAPTPAEAGVRAWVAAASYLFAVHSWLLPNTGPFLVPAVLALGTLYLPWGRMSWTLLRQPVSAARLAAAMTLVPAGWVLAEYARSWHALGGPWGLLGASQWNQPALLAPAAAGGVWAVSFLLVAVNVALAAAVSARGQLAARLGAATAGAAVVALASGYGALRALPEPVRTVRVAGVQPGVVRGGDVRFDVGERHTLALTAGQADLVVWGESSVGFDLESRPDYLRRVQSAAESAGADLLVNVDARRDRGGIVKSAVLVGPGGVRGRYEKSRLVPFGEYVPLRPLLGWVTGFTAAAEEDRLRGGTLAMLESHGLSIGPLICFESAFPDLTRRLAANGADVVVVQSATSTFQGSWAPEQHASLAAVRAVESGRTVLHATLTGVSAAFDARGRKLEWFGTAERGSYVVELPVTTGATAYVRWGDWVPAASAVALAAAVTRTVRLRRRRRH